MHLYLMSLHLLVRFFTFMADKYIKIGFLVEWNAKRVKGKVLKDFITCSRILMILMKCHFKRIHSIRKKT